MGSPGTSSVNPGYHFVGYTNTQKITARLAATFTKMDHIVLTGSSAGALGAVFNASMMLDTFGPSTPATVLLDSAAGFPDNKYMSACLQKNARTTYGWDMAIPSDCTACRQPDGSGIINMVNYVHTRFPKDQLGLIMSEHDRIFRLFYASGEGTDFTQPQNCDSNDPNILAALGGSAIVGDPPRYPADQWLAGLQSLRTTYDCTGAFSSYFIGADDTDDQRRAKPDRHPAHAHLPEPLLRAARHGDDARAMDGGPPGRQDGRHRALKATAQHGHRLRRRAGAPSPPGTEFDVVQFDGTGKVVFRKPLSSIDSSVVALTGFATNASGFLWATANGPTVFNATLEKPKPFLLGMSASAAFAWDQSVTVAPWLAAGPAGAVLYTISGPPTAETLQGLAADGSSTWTTTTSLSGSAAGPMLVDRQGEPVLLGTFQGSTTFGSAAPLTAAPGIASLSFQVFDPTGHRTAVGAWGMIGNEAASSFAVDASGNIVVAASTVVSEDDTNGSLSFAKLAR